MTAAHLRGPQVEPAPPVRGCSTKIFYLSRKEAMSEIRRRGAASNTTAAKIATAKPYHCRHCGRWHVATGRQWPGVGQP
jgi:hypothetical protein